MALPQVAALSCSSKAAVSAEGRFGWETFGKTHIPYIIRAPNDKYCSVRMVELNLLSKYQTCLHADIYSFTCISGYHITEAEATLLNEININHCDVQFGRAIFTTKDHVVRLQDLRELSNFLDVCCNKLASSGANAKDKCGFIRINKESIVPYTVKDGNKYIPLFYFEGEIKNLKLKAKNFTSLELAYLKFCCKVQGIKKELFARETFPVVSLSDVKNFYSADTVFEDYWPSKVVESLQLLTSQEGNGPSIGPTLIKSPHGSVPSQPLTVIAGKVTPSPTPSAESIPPQQMMPEPQQQQHQQLHNPHQLSLEPLQVSVPQQQPLVRDAAIAPTMGNSTCSTSNMNIIRSGDSMHLMSLQDRAGSMLQPPPLQYSLHNNSTSPSNSQQQRPINKCPPSLIPVNESTNQSYHHYVAPGAGVNEVSSPTQSPQMMAIGTQQASQQHSPPAAHNNGSLRKLIPIMEAPPSSLYHCPYKIQKAFVGGKMVPCINAKPYTYTELLITLSDLVSYVFPTVAATRCREALYALEIKLYCGNLQQMQVLKENQKCKTVNDYIPLIQLNDINHCMTRLRYILGSPQMSGEIAVKRQRTT